MSADLIHDPAKLQTTDAWRAKHAAHGTPRREAFPHPSGSWFWLVCACGAKHLTMASLDDAERG